MKEAFFMKIDDPDYMELQSWISRSGLKNPFKEFATLEDVKTHVEDPNYFNWEELWEDADNNVDSFPVPEEDPYGYGKDEIAELKKENLNGDEIWEKLKHFYMPLVGTSFACIDTDDDIFLVIERYREMLENIQEKNFLKTLRNGDYISCNISGLSERTIMIYDGDGRFCMSYNRGWKDLEKSHPGEYKNGLDLIPDSWRLTWKLVDKKTIRPANNDEITEINKAMLDSGLRVFWYAGKIHIG